MSAGGADSLPPSHKNSCVYTFKCLCLFNTTIAKIMVYTIILFQIQYRYISFIYKEKDPGV